MKPDLQTRAIEILLVEDNPSDVLMTREALSEARLLNTVHVVSDGTMALDFLRRRGRFTGAPRPDLILLDLNLPRKNGIEVLAEIKSTPDLQTIPVIILTTSGAEEDILRSYNLHANSYVIKPGEFDAFVRALQSVEHFWFGVVTLPPEQ